MTAPRLLGASSDHLVLDSGPDLPPVGTELRFGLNYSALMRSMTSPFVTHRYLRSDPVPEVPGRAARRPLPLDATGS